MLGDISFGGGINIPISSRNYFDQKKQIEKKANKQNNTTKA